MGFTREQLHSAEYQTYASHMADSLAFATIAEGQYDDTELKEMGARCLELTYDSVALAATDHFGYRIVAPPGGGSALASGAFPETHLEYRLRSELVTPMATKLHILRKLGQQAGAAIQEQAIRELARSKS